MTKRFAPLTHPEACKAIIDRLPKDRDGIPCLPGYGRYHDDFPGEMGVVRMHDWDDVIKHSHVEFDPTGDGDWRYRPVSECFGIEDGEP